MRGEDTDDEGDFPFLRTLESLGIDGRVNICVEFRWRGH
jgi:hypothetical protein